MSNAQLRDLWSNISYTFNLSKYLWFYRAFIQAIQLILHLKCSYWSVNKHKKFTNMNKTPRWYSFPLIIPLTAVDRINVLLIFISSLWLVDLVSVLASHFTWFVTIPNSKHLLCLLNNDVTSSTAERVRLLICNFYFEGSICNCLVTPPQ